MTRKLADGFLAKRAGLFGAFASARLRNRRVPIVSYLLITDRCNLRCRYCFVDVKEKRDELTTGEWLALIDEIHRRGGRMICLMGGEPLLHRDIDTIVEHIVGKGMTCDLTTNGFRVPDKLSTIRKLDSVMISLDGDQDANDANRGVHAFERAMDAIVAARSVGTAVRVNAVMTRQSQGAIDFLLDLADQHDLWVTFSLTAEFPPDAKALEREINLSNQEIGALYSRLRDAKRAGRRVLFSEQTLDYVIGYPVGYDQIVRRGDPVHGGYYRKRCPFGQTMWYVDAGGDAFPCATLWNGRFRPRNVRRDGFDAAWERVAEIECAFCFCPGVSEWNHVMSVKGALAGAAVTISQWASRMRARVRARPECPR